MSKAASHEWIDYLLRWWLVRRNMKRDDIQKLHEDSRGLLMDVLGDRVRVAGDMGGV